MPAQTARAPKRSVTLRARVVSALLVRHARMRSQMTRVPKRSVAVRARVVSALLVHRAHMRPQIARLPKRSVTMRARVVSLGPLDLLHLSWLCGPAMNAFVLLRRDRIYWSAGVSKRN